MRLSSRTTRPDRRRGRVLSPSARGAQPPTYHGPLQPMVIRRPTQTPALRGNFIVATPQEFYQTDPVPEWIGHDSNAAPIVGAYFTLEARTRAPALRA